jgi:hypothetical protein
VVSYQFERIGWNWKAECPRIEDGSNGSLVGHSENGFHKDRRAVGSIQNTRSLRGKSLALFRYRLILTSRRECGARTGRHDHWLPLTEAPPGMTYASIRASMAVNTAMR